MLLKFRIIDYHDVESGIVYTSNHWFQLEKLTKIEESKRYGGCLYLYFESENEWFYTDSYTGDELAKLYNDNEKDSDDFSFD